MSDAFPAFPFLCFFGGVGCIRSGGLERRLRPRGRDLVFFCPAEALKAFDPCMTQNKTKKNKGIMWKGLFQTRSRELGYGRSGVFEEVQYINCHRIGCPPRESQPKFWPSNFKQKLETTSKRSDGRTRVAEGLRRRRTWRSREEKLKR
jgi:hypothetical protein